MVQARLILGAILCAGALSASFDKGEEERRASDSLLILSAAEADFRGCDRDWNRVVDFWTADVSELYQTSEPEVEYQTDIRSTICRAGETCASSRLARSEEGWTPGVAGRFRVTSTDLLLPGTDNAVRVIEFTRDSGDAVPE